MFRSTLSVVARNNLKTPLAAVARNAPVFRQMSSTVHENDPVILDREKHLNLEGKQQSTHDHAPGWNEYLATSSEAHVQADKSTSDGGIESMTRTTITQIKKRHHAEDDVEGQQAAYEKDEVEGPLRSAFSAHRTASEEAVKSDRGEV